MRILLPALATVLLTACTVFGPQQVDADRPTVSYRYQSGDADQAQEKAERFCADYGLRPRLVDTGRDGSDYISRFECR